MKALVVFTDPEDTHLGWLLKPGFRHVFVCLDDGNYWTMFDPRGGQVAVQTIQTSDYDLMGYFEDQGYRVLEAEQGAFLKTPLVVNNCVGLSKAVLCIRAPLVQTPYQLYRHLRKLP